MNGFVTQWPGGQLEGQHPRRPAFARAFEAFKPLTPAETLDIERRAAEALEGKKLCWWNP